jgi:hypothetical protein
MTIIEHDGIRSSGSSIGKPNRSRRAGRAGMDGDARPGSRWRPWAGPQPALVMFRRG